MTLTVQHFLLPVVGDTACNDSIESGQSIVPTDNPWTIHAPSIACPNCTASVMQFMGMKDATNIQNTDDKCAFCDEEDPEILTDTTSLVSANRYYGDRDSENGITTCLRHSVCQVCGNEAERVFTLSYSGYFAGRIRTEGEHVVLCSRHATPVDHYRDINADPSGYRQWLKEPDHPLNHVTCAVDECPNRFAWKGPVGSQPNVTTLRELGWQSRNGVWVCSVDHAQALTA